MTLEEFKKLKPGDKLRFAKTTPTSTIKFFTGKNYNHKTELEVVHPLYFAGCFAGVELKASKGTFTCAFYEWLEKEN